MDQLITIELFGRPFTFKADSNVSRAREVADYFVSEVAKVEKQLSDKMPNIDKGSILVLTALNITSSYLESKKKYSDLLEDLNKKSAAILDRLNEKQQI